MIIVSYDISNDKLRTRFSKFLLKYGFRLQYSIFQIRNSKRILSLVSSEIKNKFEKRFGQTDSVIIFNLSEQCKITRYGYAKNDEEDLIIID
jgi:CRISPR-associated protein Cas2